RTRPSSRLSRGLGQLPVRRHVFPIPFAVSRTPSPARPYAPLILCRPCVLPLHSFRLRHAALALWLSHPSRLLLHACAWRRIDLLNGPTRLQFFPLLKCTGSRRIDAERACKFEHACNQHRDEVAELLR